MCLRPFLGGRNWMPREYTSEESLKAREKPKRSIDSFSFNFLFDHVFRGHKNWYSDTYRPCVNYSNYWNISSLFWFIHEIWPFSWCYYLCKNVLVINVSCLLTCVYQSCLFTFENVLKHLLPFTKIFLLINCCN